MTEQQKWEFLQAVVDRDAHHPKLKRIAAALWEAAASTPDQQRTFTILVHAFTGRAIRFVRDTDRTGGEDIAGLTRSPTETDAVDAIRRGTDDCDGKARAFVALCRAVGVPARMAPLWQYPRSALEPILGHVYAELLHGTEWVPVETILARAVIGEAPLDVPRERSGRWLMT
jgi:hypothetical protein